MTVTLILLTRSGHEEVQTTAEEAQALIDAEPGKYYVVNADTKDIIRQVVVEEGQTLQLIPVVQGG